LEEYIDQIAKYFEVVPLWPFFLLGVVGLVAFAVEVVNRKRREIAIENFRQTIETELVSMYPKHIRWPENINQYLCSRLPEMQYNFEVLRLFIPQNQLREYNEAWNKYCDFCRSITDEMCTSNGRPGKGAPSSHDTPDLKAVFHKLVSDLLAFTTIK